MKRLIKEVYTNIYRYAWTEAKDQIERCNVNTAFVRGAKPSFIL